MRKLSVALCVLVAGPPAASHAWQDRETRSTRFAIAPADFPNPERGFYRAARSTLETLRRDDVVRAYDDGYRLMYARIDLEPYRTADLPVGFLAALDRGFAVAGRGGVKLIVRATYNYPSGETEYRAAQDASSDQVLRHLDQLAPVLERNVGVIAFVQAGFVGAWGEWHTSSNDLTSPANRTRIRDALLRAVPASRPIQFRYPPHLQQWLPALPEYSSGSAKRFRIGFHNDCFLASQTDVGTFDEDQSVREAQKRYLDALGDIAPIGGETCNPADAPGALPRSACADILAEGERFNLSYLNDGYYRPLFHERWAQSGCMDEIRHRLGYRFELVDASHAASAKRGETLRVSATVRNSGWARLYNPRAVQVLLRSVDTGKVRRLEAQGTDARDWLPHRDNAAALQAALPDDIAAGRYDLLIALPDASPALADDARFAIRFANADDAAKGQRWEAALGAFALGTRITIR